MNYENNFNEKMLGNAKKEAAVKSADQEQPAGVPVAGMSWGAGEQVTPGGMSPDAMIGSGVNGGDFSPVTTPSDFGRPVRPASRCTTSNTGSHSNTADILRGGK
jgi:hypothetical protein